METSGFFSLNASAAFCAKGRRAEEPDPVTVPDTLELSEPPELLVLVSLFPQATKLIVITPAIAIAVSFFHILIFISPFSHKIMILPSTV